MVWLWSAGSALGVTDTQGKALRAAALSMAGTGTDTALVEQARFITVTGTLAAGYDKPDLPQWIACRRPGGQVRWTLRLPVPGTTA
jgi:hypothetical protein